MNKLPDLPSELIKLALEDLIIIEADPEYEVDMTDWHAPNSRGHCFVCLAGAVMANTLDTSRYEDVVPGEFDEDTRRKLLALNSFRMGYIHIRLKELGISDTIYSDLPMEIPITTYRDDPTEWKEGMNKMASMLEEVGL